MVTRWAIDGALKSSCFHLIMVVTSVVSFILGFSVTWPSVPSVTDDASISVLGLDLPSSSSSGSIWFVYAVSGLRCVNWPVAKAE